MNKRGYIFLLDSLVALSILGILVVFTLSQLPARGDFTSTRFDTASFLVVSVAESGEFAQVVDQASNATLVTLADAIEPHCVRFTIRSSAGALLYTATKTGCTLGTGERAQVQGSFFTRDTLYVSEVIVW